MSLRFHLNPPSPCETCRPCKATDGSVNMMQLNPETLALVPWMQWCVFPVSSWFQLDPSWFNLLKRCQGKEEGSHLYGLWSARDERVGVCGGEMHMSLQFFFCWNLCKWHSEERSPGWRAFGFIENSYVYDCAWKMSRNIFYACILKLQYFLGVRGCGTAHEGDQTCFWTCFWIYVFSFSFPLGKFHTSSPGVLVWFGGWWMQLFSPIWLMSNCRISLVKGLFCSRTALKWMPKIRDLHLIRQYFCPWEFYDIWQLMIPTSLAAC